MKQPQGWASPENCFVYLGDGSFQVVMASSTIMMEVSLEVTKEAFRTKVETVVEEMTTTEFSTTVKVMNTTRPAGLTVASITRTPKFEAVTTWIPGNGQYHGSCSYHPGTALLRHPQVQQQQQEEQHPWL